VGVICNGDIEMSGSSSGGGVTLEGAYVANEDVNLSGNVNVTGSVVAGNNSLAQFKLVSSSTSDLDGVAGSTNLTYDGGLVTFITLPSNVSIRAQRRLR
jgi:hypothetical protein